MNVTPLPLVSGWSNWSQEPLISKTRSPSLWGKLVRLLVGHWENSWNGAMRQRSWGWWKLQFIFYLFRICRVLGIYTAKPSRHGSCPHRAHRKVMTVRCDNRCSSQWSLRNTQAPPRWSCPARIQSRERGEQSKRQQATALSHCSCLGNGNQKGPLLLSGEWESERVKLSLTVSPDTKHDPCRIPHWFGPGFLIRPMVSDLIRSEEGCSIDMDPDAGKDSGPEEKGAIEDEMAGWHQQLNGHEFELTPRRTGNLGVLHSLGSQRARHNWMTE